MAIKNSNRILINLFHHSFILCCFFCLYVILCSFGSWSVNLLFVVSATPGEVGVNLKQGYNGELTSKQAGSVGGQMVKKMIESYENGLK